MRIKMLEDRSVARFTLSAAAVVTYYFEKKEKKHEQILQEIFNENDVVSLIMSAVK